MASVLINTLVVRSVCSASIVWMDFKEQTHLTGRTEYEERGGEEGKGRERATGLNVIGPTKGKRLMATIYLRLLRNQHFYGSRRILTIDKRKNGKTQQCVRQNVQ